MGGQAGGFAQNGGSPDRSSPGSRPGPSARTGPGTQPVIDDPDLYIASIALARNLALVTDDGNAGMARIKAAAEAVFQRGEFPLRLRVENWLELISKCRTTRNHRLTLPLFPVAIAVAAIP